MNGIHLIVTSGGTREPIDDVRFIGNASTGRLGAAIAARAAARGHHVTLIHAIGSALPDGWGPESGWGPDMSGLDTGSGPDAGLGPGGPADRTRMRSFVTAADLSGALEEELAAVGDPCAVVMAAAVADYRPERKPGKISSRAGELVISLKRIPKIVDKVKGWKADSLLVKFKLESGRRREELIAIGKESAERSKADLVLVNDVAAMSGGRHPAHLFRPGRAEVLDLEGKEAIADAIVTALEEIVKEKGGDR